MAYIEGCESWAGVGVGYTEAVAGSDYWQLIATRRNAPVDDVWDETLFDEGN